MVISNFEQLGTVTYTTMLNFTLSFRSVFHCNERFYIAWGQELPMGWGNGESSLKPAQETRSGCCGQGLPTSTPFRGKKAGFSHSLLKSLAPAMALLIFLVVRKPKEFLVLLLALGRGWVSAAHNLHHCLHGLLFLLPACRSGSGPNQPARTSLAGSYVQGRWVSTGARPLCRLITTRTSWFDPKYRWRASTAHPCWCCRTCFCMVLGFLPAVAVWTSDVLFDEAVNWF